MEQKTENYNLTLKLENCKIRWFLIDYNKHIYAHKKVLWGLEVFFLNHSYIKVLQDKGKIIYLCFRASESDKLEKLALGYTYSFVLIKVTQIITYFS